MKKAALLLAPILVTCAYPAMANPHRNYQNYHHLHRHTDNLRAHSHITCEMVRTYVAQLGLEQARAVAAAAGMTASEERRAKRCLADKV